MNILVTGATGFIGSHLVRRLRDNNHVYCLVRKRGQIEELPNQSVIECDLGLPLNSNLLPTDIRAIVHLAQANVPFPEKANELYRVNTVSTQELLHYGFKSGITTFIYASSGGVYGSGNRRFSEDDIPQPLDYYSVTKYCSELLVSQYRQHFNTVILRFFAPYGVGQKNRLIPNLIERIKKGDEILIYNEGNPRMNPLYITDVVEIIARALTLSDHRVINVGGQESYNIREIAELMGKLLNVAPRYKFLVDKSKQDLVGDVTLMKSLLGYEPKISLAEGLRLMISNNE